MTDLVVGLGQIGLPIHQLLKVRNFKVHGYDINKEKSLVKLEKMNRRYEAIHICFPYLNERQFSKYMLSETKIPYNEMTDTLVIHSTVKPGTSKKYSAIYSPIRGTHNDMFENLQWFSKYYSSRSHSKEFEKRFPNCIRVTDSVKLERTKVVDTTYEAFLIAFRKYIDQHYPIYWSFEYELHQKYGNRPIMYNDGKPIGGHCLIPNLDLLGDKFLGDFIRRYG